MVLFSLPVGHEWFDINLVSLAGFYLTDSGWWLVDFLVDIGWLSENVVYLDS